MRDPRNSQHLLGWKQGPDLKYLWQAIWREIFLVLNPFWITEQWSLWPLAFLIITLLPRKFWAIKTCCEKKNLLIKDNHNIWSGQNVLSYTCYADTAPQVKTCGDLHGDFCADLSPSWGRDNKKVRRIRTLALDSPLGVGQRVVLGLEVRTWGLALELQTCLIHSWKFIRTILL